MFPAFHQCADVPDWRCLTHASRPNGLLIGPTAATSAVLGWLGESLGVPVAHWPRDGAVWTNHQSPRTLVLHQITALNRGDQLSLLAWLSEPGRRVQVISLASQDVYPLVQSGAFLDTLYYRLNCVVVDCRDVMNPIAGPACV